MPMANNPQTFLNTYMSTMRNSIITVSLGIGIYGFSRHFKNRSKEILKTLSILMYTFSVGILYNCNIYLKNYLDNLSHDEIKEAPRYIDFNIWKNFEYLGWGLLTIYIIFLSLGVFSIIKDFM